jgi:AcrR family transcriptional regulator
VSEIIEKRLVPGATRRARSEERRRRILEAARACFGRNGYAGATVEAIAAEAGVSNGLLYQFFRSKDHLLRVVLEELIQDWVRVMVPREGVRPASASERLEAMLRRSVEFCRTNPLLAALFASDRALQLERFSEAGADRVEPHRRLVASILREGIATGEFRADLDVASAADVICQLHAHYAARFYTRDPHYPATGEIIDATVRFIHDAVRAR